MSDSYLELLKHPNWQKKRLEILQRDEFICQWCQSDDRTLNVHHLRYLKGAKPWEYPEDLLITLCEECHSSAETLLKQIRQMFAFEPHYGVFSDVITLLSAHHWEKVAYLLRVCVEQPDLLLSIVDFCDKETKPAKRPKHPSLDEIKLIGAKQGITEEDCVALWNKWQGNGWRNNGQPIRSVAHTMAAWKGYGYLPSQRKMCNNGHSVFALKAVIEAKERIADDLKRKFASQVADGVIWSDQTKRQEYATLRAQVKDLTARIGASA